MILESGQMLSTAVKLLDPEYAVPYPSLYKITHANHPCSKWVRESRGNFSWCLRWMDSMEHQRVRAGCLSHKTYTTLYPILVSYWEDGWFPSEEFTTPPRCNPFKKSIVSTAETYRDTMILKWNSDTPPPTWKHGKEPPWRRI